MSRSRIRTCTAIALLISGIAGPVSFSATAVAASMEEAGKKIAFTRSKGNCLACHMIPGGESPGTIAPPLIAMKARFPEKKTLRAQIWDATQRNPETSMPPFGKHKILTEKEIQQLVEFIWAQ